MEKKSEELEMLQRCLEEIKSLRRDIDHLRPKADAYDNLSIVLRMMPRPPMTCTEDLAWVLERRIEEMTTPVAPPTEEA